MTTTDIKKHINRELEYLWTKIPDGYKETKDMTTDELYALGRYHALEELEFDIDRLSKLPKLN